MGEGESQMAVKKSARNRPKKGVSKRSAAKPPSTSRPPARKIRPGFISHTELASADPPATKAWCQEVLGWKFVPPVPTPAGPYHMWSFSDNNGGGIRANSPPEAPGSIPYCEVANIRVAFQKALKAGAKEMVPPGEIPGGMGWIAMVQAPGGVVFGFWGPR